MTVSSELTPQVQYTANGTAVFFEFDVGDLSEAEVVVYVDSEIVHNYSLQDNGVLFDTPPPSRSIVRITKETDITQLRDWRPFGPFEAEKTEGMMDKLIVLKGEAKEFRADMNLSISRTPAIVTIHNDKGSDALVPLWNHTLPEAGMFSATVSDQTPLDGTPTDDPDSHVYIEFPTNVPPPFPPTDEYGIVAGYQLLDSQFTGAQTPVTNRTHPLAGLYTTEFTAFYVFRWTPVLASVGAVLDMGMFELDIVRRPATNQYYVGYEFSDDTETLITGGTAELGNLDSVNPFNFDDWICVMISIQGTDLAQGSGGKNFNWWVVNLTKGAETDFSTEWDEAGVGTMGWATTRDRTGDSRAGLNEYLDGSGVTAIESPIAMVGFDPSYVDFSIESNRELVCSLTQMADHGLAGANVFGHRAAYYSLSGAPNLNEGYINVGNPRLSAVPVYATGDNLPPVDFQPYVHPLADWVYDDMAAAEASGDAWVDGDTVHISEGQQDMLFLDKLNINGHNGLVHRGGTNTDDIISDVTVVETQPEGTDPQTWGWTLNTIGTEGVDWAIDVNAGRARVAKLTNGGRASIASPATVGGQERAFFIVDRYTAENGGNLGANSGLLLSSFVSKALLLQSASSAVPPTPPSNTHAFQVPGAYANSLLVEDVEKRVWVYVDADYVTIWDDTGLIIKEDALAAGGAPMIEIICSELDANAEDVRMGYHIAGSMP